MAILAKASALLLVGLSFVVPVCAQESNEVNVLSVVGSGQFIHSSPQISFLGGSQLKLYKYTENFFFTPNPVADWLQFNEELGTYCSTNPSEASVSIPLKILFYESTTISELAASAGIEPNRITTIPSYGYSVFVREKNSSGATKAVYSTLSSLSLLTGEKLSGEFDIPSSKTFFLETGCERLADFQRGLYEIDVRFHVRGSTFEKSSLSAELAIKDTLALKLQAERKVEEENKTVVATTGKNSGGAIRLGPVSFGGSKSSTSTSTNVERSRVIDEDWVQGLVASTLATLNVQKVCGGSATCNDKTFSELLTRFLDGYVESAKASIEKKSSGSYELTIAGVPKEVEVKIDDEVKAELNNLLERLTENDSEVEFMGVKAKAKKIEDDKIQFDGKTEWKRHGTEWVPTSFEVKMLNETDLTNKISVSYSSALLGSVEKVSVKGGQYEPASSSLAEQNSMLTAIQRLQNLEKRKLSCRLFRNSEKIQNAGKVSARIESDGAFVLAGGGCEIFDNTKDRWSIISSGGPEDSQLSWLCEGRPVPNFPNSYTLRATAIGCKFE